MKSEKNIIIKLIKWFFFDRNALQSNLDIKKLNTIINLNHRGK